jgi:hypothetical protein
MYRLVCKRPPVPILTVHDVLHAGFAGCDFHVHGEEEEIGARFVGEHRETKDRIGDQ